MGLHLFANDNPAAFERLAILGTHKLYLLMRLDRRALGQLLRRKLHPIPGTNEKRPLEALTYPQLAAVIAALLGAPPASAEPLAALEKKVNALATAVADLIEHHPDLDPESLTALHQTLLTATTNLAEAFNLSS